MAYRTQQYVATNRAFGPYLPPYPLQGVGGYRSMRGLGAADCSMYQSDLAYKQNDLNEKQAALNDNPDSVDLQSQIRIAQQELDAAKSDLASCLAVGPAPPSPNATCPAGQHAEDAGGMHLICVPDGPGPTPTPPGPGPTPKPPTPTPTPVVKKAETNWLLIGGVVAAVGVVGYLAFTQGGGKKGGYHVASNPRRRSRRY